MNKTITDLRGEDIIDSRDVIQRIEDLQDELSSAQECENPEHETDRVPAPDTTIGAYCGACMSEDDYQELTALQKLASQCEGYGDWAHGEALIRDSYFETYAQELADDIGATNAKATWPLNHIDWTAAADELKQDYMSVDFDGTEYWMRSC